MPGTIITVDSKTFIEKFIREEVMTDYQYLVISDAIKIADTNSIHKGRISILRSLMPTTKIRSLTCNSMTEYCNAYLQYLASPEIFPTMVTMVKAYLGGLDLVLICADDEEKEMKSKRKQIQEKLIKFATRIPVFMYLTDYRERCLKDVITQLEPGLFKKVTGLSVEDFNMLCTLGVFNAPLMNDAIFKFKRYEDASLTYTGIDKHTDDEVGGWDTTIRKTQYEKLFYNQQSSMSEVDYSSYTMVSEKVEVKRVEQETSVNAEHVISKPVIVSSVDSQQKSKSEQIDVEFKAKLDSLTTDSVVSHKKFGKGTVVKINNNEKYIYIKFALGEKKFIFPDAFVMGFLEVCQCQ